MRGIHGTAAAQLQLQQGPAELCGGFQPAGGRFRPARPRCSGPGTADLRPPPGPAGPRCPGRQDSSRDGSRDGRHRRTSTPWAVRPAGHTWPTALPPAARPNPPPLPKRARPLLPEQPRGCAAHGSRSSAGPRSTPHLALACGDSGAAAGLPWRSWARPGRGSADAAPHTRGQAGAAAATPPRDAPRTKMAAPSASAAPASAAPHKDGGAGRAPHPRPAAHSRSCPEQRWRARSPDAVGLPHVVAAPPDR